MKYVKSHYLILAAGAALAFYWWNASRVKNDGAPALSQVVKSDAIGQTNIFSGT